MQCRNEHLLQILPLLLPTRTIGMLTEHLSENTGILVMNNEKRTDGMRKAERNDILMMVNPAQPLQYMGKQRSRLMRCGEQLEVWNMGTIPTPAQTAMITQCMSTVPAHSLPIGWKASNTILRNENGILATGPKQAA